MNIVRVIAKADTSVAYQIGTNKTEFGDYVPNETNG